MPDDTPLILRVLAPLEGVIEGAADIIYLLRQDARVIGMLAAYARKYGIAGLIRWLEQGGDAV